MPMRNITCGRLGVFILVIDLILALERVEQTFLSARY